MHCQPQRSFTLAGLDRRGPLGKLEPVPGAEIGDRLGCPPRVRLFSYRGLAPALTTEAPAKNLQASRATFQAKTCSRLLDSPTQPFPLE